MSAPDVTEICEKSTKLTLSLALDKKMISLKHYTTVRYLGSIRGQMTGEHESALVIRRMFWAASGPKSLTVAFSAPSRPWAHIL